MGKRKGNKLHQNVTPGNVVKPRPIMWELRTLNKAFPLLNWLQYLKESYLEAAEDLTRTDFMDINCLTYFSHFYADGVLLNGGGAIGLVLLLDGWETCGGALSAIWGPVLSSLNPKHASGVKTFCKLRDRGFSELNICSKTCFLKQTVSITKERKSTSRWITESSVAFYRLQLCGF